MRITVMALGSQGDVFPYALLGRALQDAGHRVLFTTFQSFAPLVTGLGLAFHPVRGDARAVLQGASALAGAGQDALRVTRAVLRAYGQAMVESYLEAFSAPPLLESEAVINQLPASLFGYDLAERLGVPYFEAAVIPLEPTRAWPLPLLPQRSLGGWYNRLTYALMRQVVWQAFRPAVNRYRAVLGLPPAPLRGYPRRAVPVLNGFSPHVVPRPPDWGDHVHVTGYWVPAPDPAWQPPADLLAFLEAGPPPVFIGFGSMPLPDPDRTTALLLDALRRSGQRGLLHGGWAGIATHALPAGVFKIGYTPYDWLFPRVRAVVHHGGSGTTGAALRAGVPAILVPFAVDQYYWGGRVVALGVGPQPVPFNTLSAERLAYAIRVAVEHAPLRRRAAELGARLRAEDGLAQAVRVVNRYLGAHP